MTAREHVAGRVFSPSASTRARLCEIIRRFAERANLSPRAHVTAGDDDGDVTQLGAIIPLGARKGREAGSDPYYNNNNARVVVGILRILYVRVRDKPRGISAADGSAIINYYHYDIKAPRVTKREYTRSVLTFGVGRNKNENRNQIDDTLCTYPYHVFRKTGFYYFYFRFRAAL